MHAVQRSGGICVFGLTNGREACAFELVIDTIDTQLQSMRRGRRGRERRSKGNARTVPEAAHKECACNEPRSRLLQNTFSRLNEEEEEEEEEEEVGNR